MDQRTNPYRHATPSDLHRTCCEIISALEAVQASTPAKRRALVGQTRMLLLVLAQRLHEPSMPATPEHCLRTSTNPDLVVELLKLHVNLTNEGLRAARTETIQRAADYVLRRDAWEWLHGKRGSPDGPLCNDPVNSCSGVTFD